MGSDNQAGALRSRLHEIKDEVGELAKRGRLSPAETKKLEALTAEFDESKRDLDVLEVGRPMMRNRPLRL